MCDERVDVCVCKMVGLDYVLDVHLLGKVDRKRTVRVGWPLKVSAKELVDIAHEFDPEFGCKMAFEMAFDLRVFGEVEKSST